MGKIDSTRFGEIEYDDNRVISMPQGIIGFGNKQKYILLQPDDDALFFWLQSLDDPSLAFVITNPRHFIPDYKASLTTAERNFLELKDEKEIGVWVIVTVPEGDPRGITANMLAPVILHYPTSRAWQVVLEDVDYGIRHPLVAPEEDE
ncbi:MAG: flagellar assembly protein FliW [Candidatus Dadabacteria bacterium]|nr:flagellar assembly protein FliW [Candidatus Dadabacteria bacterium]